MKWFLISLAALLLPACGTPTDNGDDGPAPGCAYLTVINGLEESITELNCYGPIGGEEPWYNYIIMYGEDPLMPGESVTAEVGIGRYNLNATDKSHENYHRWDVNVTEDGYTWEITLEDQAD
ncbi:MAG TPA: hypothetical protein VM054_00770 [bacterium]|nr:hypothetical protein [bacterium]